MKIQVTSYAFNASAKTVTFSGYGSISLHSVLLITNVTAGIIIYNFGDSTKGGSVATNVLTLTYNTTAMSNTDKLLIYYDDSAINASTKEKQPALGTAGSASADVLTVQGITSMTPLKTDSSATTQPVSASSLPLPTGAATAANQTTGNTSVGNIDTTTGATADAVVAAGAAGSVSAKLRRVTTDLDSVKTSVSSIDGKITAANTGAVTVSSSALPTGAATAAKQPALGTAGSASTDVLSVQGITSMTPLKVDASATTQPVSGTVSVTGVATSTKQSDGTQKTQVVDGSGNVIGATSNALDVNIKSGSSAGTQYTEDAVAATDPIGNMLLARRKDTLSTSEVSADGDNIALNSTNKGQLHVKLADTVVVDGSGVTQPVSASSLPLPTGAATAAKQPALGTAGTPSADVLTVQGSGSMTALKVDASATTQPVSGTVSVTGVATATKQSDGTQKTQIVDGSGSVVGSTSNALDVNIKSGASSGTQYTEDAVAAADPVGTALNLIRKDTLAALTSADGDNVAARGTDKGELYVKHTDAIPITDNGGSLTVDGTVSANATLSAETTKVIGTVNVAASQSIGVTQATGTNLHTVVDSGTVTTVSTVTNLSQIGGAAVAMGTGVRSSGTQRVTIATDDVVPASQSGTWTVQPGNTANTTPWLTSSQAPTVGGWTPSMTISAASTNATSLKASAGNIGSIQVFNNSATIGYLKIYNKASAPTVGTDTPVKVILIPGNTGGAGAVVPLGDAGVSLGTGIAFAITGGIANSDTTAVAASTFVVNIDYK